MFSEKIFDEVKIVKEKRYVNAIIGLGVSIFLLGASTIGTTPKMDFLKELVGVEWLRKKLIVI